MHYYTILVFFFLAYFTLYNRLQFHDDPVYETAKKTQMCIEQSYGLCGRGRGWDDLGEWH